MKVPKENVQDWINQQQENIRNNDPPINTSLRQRNINKLSQTLKKITNPNGDNK